MMRSRVGGDGFVAGVGDEHHFNSRKALCGQRLVMDANLEIGAQFSENILVVAVGKVTAFSLRVEIAAVEQHRFAFCLRIGAHRSASSEQ